VLRIDGVGGALVKALGQLPMLEASQDGAVKIFSFKGALPLEGIKPVFAVDGQALYVATTIGFLNECRQRKSGLDQNVEFQKALAQVGFEGNGLAYVSPKFLARLRQLAAINPKARPETKRIFEMIALQIPALSSPIITERINLPDGILVRGQSYRSLKQDLALVSVYNPITIGLFAAMAIPAFQKVRETSQEKAIQNNLRQFSAGAQQYMMETAKTVATYDDIVGPNKIIRELRPVAGEDYTSLVVHQSDNEISVRTAAGKVIKSSW
jgi:type IV pilus assembly protein PilA